jgi:hypothetical protein
LVKKAVGTTGHEEFRDELAPELLSKVCILSAVKAKGTKDARRPAAILLAQ